MANDVKVVIDLKKAAGKLGFGMPLIFSAKAESEVTYTECSNIEAVAAAGAETSTDLYKAAQLVFMQDNAPAKIAVCASKDGAVAGLQAVAAKNWRQLVVMGLSEEEGNTLKGVADYIEGTNDKMLFASVKDLSAITALKSLKRTVAFYYNNAEVSAPAAALVGATAGRKAGSFTYKNLVLKGFQPLTLTDAQVDAAHEAGAITFVTKAGDNVTSEGKNMAGEYIDIVDSQDYIISNLEYQTQKVLNQQPKVPYDNTGIALLESVALNVMKDAYNNGMIATNEDGTPAFTVNYALREEVSEADRAERKYLGGQFSFQLAGAVHEVEIYGEILV